MAPRRPKDIIVNERLSVEEKNLQELEKRIREQRERLKDAQGAKAKLETEKYNEGVRALTAAIKQAVADTDLAQRLWDILLATHPNSEQIAVMSRVIGMPVDAPEATRRQAS